MASRLIGMLAACALLFSSLFAGVGGPVLCFGSDGHVAVEAEDFGVYVGAPLLPDRAERMYVRAPQGHHAEPCVDVALLSNQPYAKSDLGQIVDGEREPPQPASSGFLPSQPEENTRSRTIMRGTVSFDVRLRELRTIILLT